MVSSFYYVCLFGFFEIECHCSPGCLQLHVDDSPQLLLHLPPPPKCADGRHGLPCSANFSVLKFFQHIIPQPTTKRLTGAGSASQGTHREVKLSTGVP